MTSLEKRQEAMRLKHRARRLEKMQKQMAKAAAAKERYVPPVKVKKIRAKVLVMRPIPGDISAEKLYRMEELAYRISKRKVRLTA